MICSVIKSTLVALGLAFLAQTIFSSVQSRYVYTFLSANLINVQVALLAINTATLGIVLTKLRDLTDRGGSSEQFHDVRRQMLLSIKEQIALVFFAIIFLSLQEAKNLPLVVPSSVFDTLLLGCFFYTIAILYDTAKSVFVLLGETP